MDVLAQVKRETGNIVWMSAEPVSWDLTKGIDKSHPLDWIVIGAASNGKQYFQPDPDHIRKLLEVMDATGTPVFYKGNIRPLFEANDLGSDELNRWREDFPWTYRDGKLIPAVVRRDEECIRRGWTRSRLSPELDIEKLKAVLKETPPRDPIEDVQVASEDGKISLAVLDDLPTITKAPSKRKPRTPQSKRKARKKRKA